MAVSSNTNVPSVGLAFGPGVLEFVRERPGHADHIEVPFEQLLATPEILGDLRSSCPIVLHCASLSLGGFCPPEEKTVIALERCVAETATPWVGEHLAFLAAESLTEPDEVSRLTYTICPQLSEETVERAVRNIEGIKRRIAAPLILENSPQYFEIPGSTMTMVDFVNEIVIESGAGLLLDLSHFCITCLNSGLDPHRELDRLVLERVVEVHMSGYEVRSGIMWDDHASPAPELLFTLLERVVSRAPPKAITFEYNWAGIPPSLIARHLSRAREIAGAA